MTRDPSREPAAPGMFMASLAVVRVQGEDRETFRRIFAAALRRLEEIREAQPGRWNDLLWLVVSCAFRRPEEEWEELVEAARQGQVGSAHADEIVALMRRAAVRWEQELIARGEPRVRVVEPAEVDLDTRREGLRRWLEQRVGPLPEALARTIAEEDEPEQLRSVLREILYLAGRQDLAR